jgi:HSP20 family protein
MAKKVKVRKGPPAVRAGSERSVPAVPFWERELDRLFDEFRQLPWPRLWDEPWWPTRSLRLRVPALDVYEENEEIVVKGELPGLSKDNIQVDLTGNRLTIKGEKKKHEEVKSENYYRSERSFGSFARTVELPVDVKVDAAKASFKDGILEVRLPKSEEAKKKQVKLPVE